MESKQNLLAGLRAGLIAAIAGAAIWTAISLLTGFHISLVAISIGVLVGFAVREYGHGLIIEFQVMGAVLALLGCAMGNLAIVAWFVAPEFGFSFIEMTLIMLTNPEVAVPALSLTFTSMDLVFYGLAMFFAYKLSLRTYIFPYSHVYESAKMLVFRYLP